MKKVGWISLAVIVYLVALLALFPARFALQFAPLPENVQLGGVSGSIWHGYIDALRVDNYMLRDIQWRLTPWALLTGQLRVNVTINDHADNIVVGSAKAHIRRHQLALYDVQADARLTDLLMFSPQPVPVQMRGQVELAISRFIYGQPLCRELAGNLYLRNAAMQVGNNWESLGSFDTSLSCSEGQVMAEVGEPNVVGLSAAVVINPHGAQGEFELTPGADAPRTVRNLINMMPPQARQRQSFTLRF